MTAQTDTLLTDPFDFVSTNAKDGGLLNISPVVSTPVET